MRRSKILAKIRSGQVARVCSTGQPIGFYPAMASHFQFDGIWVDAEHRTWDPREVEMMLARHHAADIDCLWRPPSKEKNALYRLLEEGASGLMIPHVGSADEARALVRAMKFPPLGDRGFCGGGRDADFWIGKPADYLERANAETFLTVQIETPEALERVDEIASVPGVDVLFLGPGDLSIRLGCTPAVSDPVMNNAQQIVADACKKHGKAWGRPAGSPDDVKALVNMGAQLIAFGSEFGGLYQHLAQCAGQLDVILKDSPAVEPAPAGRSY